MHSKRIHVAVIGLNSGFHCATTALVLVLAVFIKGDPSRQSGARVPARRPHSLQCPYLFLPQRSVSLIVVSISSLPSNKQLMLYFSSRLNAFFAVNDEVTRARPEG